MLASDQALPGFQPVAFSGQVEVRVQFQTSLGTFLPFASAPYYGDASVAASRDADHYHLRYQDGIEFLISAAGDAVWVHCPPTKPFDVAAAYFTGPVIGLVLRIRGVLCLHASAIQTATGVFALCGARGAGKSTLAASFALSAHRVLSDDVVALQQDAESFLVPPSWARFKLWPDSIEALYGSETDFPPLDSESVKRVVYALPTSNDAPAALRTIYLIDEGSAETGKPKIEEIDSMRAMVALASHTYCNYLLTPEMRRREFEQLQQLMRTITVRQLTVPRDFKALPAVRSALLEDFAAQSRSMLRSC